MTENLKKCGKCKQFFPATEEYFFKANQNKDGLYRWCKTCKKIHYQNFVKQKKLEHQNITEQPNETKKCATCNQEFPKTLEYYKFTPSSKDGFSYSCNKCSKLIKLLNKKKNIQLNENVIYDESIIEKCVTCGIEFPFTPDYFLRNKSRKNGLTKRCKQCHKHKTLNSATKNKEHNESRMDYLLSLTTEITIKCNRCKKDKFLNKENFRIETTTKNGFYSICQECVSKQNREILTKTVQYNSIPARNLSNYMEIYKHPTKNILQVKCYYCNQIFTPLCSAVKEKLSSINNFDRGESQLYCSDNCKQSCPSFGAKLVPRSFEKATSRETNTVLRKIVLERDNWQCQRCEKTIEEAPLHVHHILSYKINTWARNDPDNCITLCKNCHNDIHHTPGCKYHEIHCPIS